MYSLVEKNVVNGSQPLHVTAAAIFVLMCQHKPLSGKHELLVWQMPSLELS